MRRNPIQAPVAHFLLLSGAILLAACDPPRCQGSAPRTIEKFVSPGVPVSCEDNEPFELDSGIVNFTSIRYGELMNCDEGSCLSSRLCAIEDVEDVFLYKVRWFNQDERPVGLLEACPGYQEPANELDTLECGELANGREHPLTQSSKFKEFRKNQLSNVGPFHLCY